MSKRHLTAVLLLASISLGAIAQTRPASAPASQPATKTFKSHPYKFTVELPTAWRDRKPQPTGTVFAIEPANDSSVLIEIQIKGEGKFKPEQIDQLVGAMKDQIKHNDANAEIDEVKDEKLGDSAAKRVSYITTINETRVKFAHIVTIKNGRAYVLEMLAPAEKFADFSAEFDGAAKSFNFTSP